jgi:arylsulfatase A
MQADPAETTDVSAEHPEVARELALAYDAWYSDVFAEAGVRPAIPVGHPAGPLVELPASEAYSNGGIHFQGKAGWAHDWLTGWTDVEDAVTWELDVLQAGDYDVSLLYACPPADVGARLMISTGDHYLMTSVTQAHDPQPLPTRDRVPRTEVPVKVWAELEAGTLRLEAGRTPLAIRALDRPGEQVIDLKAVRLKRK